MLHKTTRHFSGLIFRRRASTSANPAPALNNDLLHLILQQIRAHGPISLSRYMSYCLSHPTLGYYARSRLDDPSKTVLGKQGDFITSPEISQVFGELIGIWFVAQWQLQGSPARCQIIELGPGRGTLMADMLRTFTQIKPFSSALQAIHLVETSDFFKKAQKDNLSTKTKESGVSLTWHNSLNDVLSNADDQGFTAILAHEFFDALPISLFEKRPEGWREVLVDEAQQEIIVSGKKKAPLRLAVARAETMPSRIYTRSPRFAKLSAGSRIEICPEAATIAGDMARLIGCGSGGAGLIIDYGDARFFSNSFRGFRNHQIVETLDEPGHTDLTANVDFDYLSEAVRSEGASPSSLLTQRSFLQRMGLDVRLKVLLEKAETPERKEQIKKATDRLIDPVGMGQQYKFMAVTPGTLYKPYPFL